MIYLSFNITNPWCRRFENVWNKVYSTPHPSKYLELEVMKDSTVVSFMFRLATRTDHAGVNVELGLFGYSFNINFYDIRHWNPDKGRYYIYSEEEGSH